MGNILKNGPRVYRLVIHKRQYIELILLIFNGNIILPSKKAQFNKFLCMYNKKPVCMVIPYISSNLHISFDNTWLLGFTEAEGCLNISFLHNSTAFRVRFIISQKHDINLPILCNLILLFMTGKIKGHSKKDNYSYIVSGFKNIHKIFCYFDKYEFLGIKKVCYNLFKTVIIQIQNKNHLTEKRKHLIDLSHNINRISRKTK